MSPPLPIGQDSTELLRGAAEHVGEVIEAMAAKSEESASAAQEVSASTVEQTSAFTDVTAGARELASLASGLNEFVRAFHLRAL